MIHRRLFSIVWITITAIATFVSLSVAADPSTQPSKEHAAPAAQQAPEVLKPAPNDLLDTVQNKLHEIRSMEGDFDQTVYLKGFDRTETFSGHFAAKEPDLVIWIVKTSPGSAIRVQGEELYVWDPGVKKPRIIDLSDNPTFKAVAQQSKDWAGGKFKALSESYDVYVLNAQPLSLRFVPKPGTGLAKIFSNVEATLTDDSSSIVKIIYRHPGGDVTTVTFKDCKVNQPIKPATWDFKP